MRQTTRLASPARLVAAGLLAAISLLAPAGSALAGSAVGDAGHYLSAGTRVCLLNPTGEAFHVTLARFVWWIGGGWNRPDFKVRLTDPGGKVLLDETRSVDDAGHRIDVPAGAKGAYTLDVSPAGTTLSFWYVTASLPRAVAWTGPGSGDAVQARWFLCNPFVPRKWYFWVPAGTKKFTLRSQNNSGRSQREDHGMTIFSPRGQRVAVLWGQANPDEPEQDFGDKVRRRAQQATVLVEPGAAGRFWSVEVRMGDSHTYSDVNISLEGVPPYLARSPEEWFDADTGEVPAVSPYDDEEFVQSDRSEAAKKKDPLIQHWTPCPALGDPDACEIRCPARVALWNPDGRELKFVIGTYLPRNMFPGTDPKTGKATELPEDQHDHADVKVVAGGRTVLDERLPLLHLHGGERTARQLATGRGVATIDVAAAEHFWMYTYPATPLVMVGREVEGGWRRFAFEAGTGRNWYFFVPRGTKAFRVRAAAAHEGDVMRLEVNAPDRVMAAIYDRQGEREVVVPEGLDGKVWHVRLDFGGATRFGAGLPRARFPSLDVTLDLKGVPGLLAPTWEQWFDPADPRPPARRAGE